MIKQIRPAFYHNKRNSQYCCLSTDTIPDYLENGDEVYFIDTGKKYVYDSVSGQLYEKQSGGGGGTSVYPYNNNPEALGHEANPGTSDNYSRGDHIHPLPSVSDLGALPVGNIANEFSTSSTYAVGDYVIYEGQLYQCTTAVTTAGSWNSSNWVQAVLGNDVSDLKSALDTIVRSGAVNDTASGSIASFTDGADNVPVKDLTVAIEPVQDLHGYDNPWPAGGGKNLLWLNNGIFKTGAFQNTTPRETTGVGTWVGMTSSNYLAPNSIVSYTIGDNNLTVEATANGYGVGFECKLTAGQQYTLSWVGTNAYVGIAFYDDNGEYLSYVTSGASPKTFTVPESTANAIIVLRGDGANVTGEFSNIQLEEGQTATAYSPYANICPISGWTGANVTRTGKNLIALIGTNTTDVIPTINETTGEVSIADTTTIKWASKPFGYSDVVAEQTYIFSATGIKYGRIGGSMNTAYPNASAGNIPDCTTSGGGITAIVNKNATARTFTPHFTGRIYWHFCTDTDNGSSHQAFTMTPMIEIGSTASSFEPYSGTTYPIPLGQTVYGGTLDVTTGKLTVDRAMVDLGTKNWYSSTSAGRIRFRTSITDIERISSPNVRASLLCSNYPTKTANQTYQGTIGVSLQQNSADIYIYDPQTESMTTAEFKSAMSGVQLCYKLATPITYDLTPTEVKTLLAQNNIWADCGDSTVNYFADTKLYIDKKITAPASPASGQYLSWNGSAWVAASLPVYNGGVA